MSAMMFHTSLLLAVLSAFVVAQNAAPKKPREQFRVIYEWTSIDYDWKSQQDRDTALNTSAYIPKNVLISGINYYDGKLFLTVPRMMPGVPATLATVPVTPGETSPKLTPFPTWEMNKIGDCTALQFVQNVEVDKNGVLWILDNGRTGTLTEAPDSRCPPSLVLIDLKGGKNTMERIPFPEEVAPRNSTYLNDLVVDNSDGDYAYITDNSATDPGIIVFRRADSKSWKIRDALSMTAVQYASNFRINGTSVTLPVNIDGIALGPPVLKENGMYDRSVYYSPLSSYHLYAVNTSVLRNESNSRSVDAIRSQVRDIGTKASQTDGMKMDSNGVLYYGLVGNYTIAEWNTTTDFRSGQRTIARDANYIQWVDRFAFDDIGNIYVVVNRLYNFVANRTNLEDVNYRILKANVGSKSYVHVDVPPSPISGATTSVVSVLMATLMLVLAQVLV